MAKTKTVYVCSQCGAEEPKWAGHCPECGSGGSMIQETRTTGSRRQRRSPLPAAEAGPVLPLHAIEVKDDMRSVTGIAELDRVLGGGIVEGSLVLVGGDPGIGKSTLLLQMCQKLSDRQVKVLYVSGEESPRQIKIRGTRLGAAGEQIYLYAETSLERVEAAIESVKPQVLVLDSIQTIYSEAVESSPGSVSQVREVTSRLMHIAKSSQVATFIIGHVTKDGAIAGPRVLEHMVDTVLYFEGDRSHAYRVLRAVKNRFGSTNEIGVFEMMDAGLEEVANPSAYLLAGKASGESGSATACCLEGTRPLLIEVQALASYTNFNMARRTANGTDANRVNLLIAVLEKKMGMQWGGYDCYVNIAGGMKVTEPALDLALTAALASTYKNRTIPSGTVLFGEVGLTGEVRAVSQSDRRLAEAAKMGFDTCILPAANARKLGKGPGGMRIVGAATVKEALDACFR